MASPLDHAVKPTRKAKVVHIAQQPITITNWHQHIVWINVTFVILVHLVGFIAAYYTPLQRNTAIWALVYYFLTGLGITAGTVHRAGNTVFRANRNRLS